MTIRIQDKTNFLKIFLSPLSKINSLIELKLFDDNISCFVDKGSDVFLVAKYNCDIIGKDRDELVIPDATNFIKALNCIKSTSIDLEVIGNHLYYHNNNFKFKYFLFDEKIRKTGKVFERTKELKKDCLLNFEIKLEHLKSVTKMLPLITENSKMYLYSDEGKIFATLTDKTLTNTDSYTIILSENYVGEDINDGDLIVNLEVFKMLNTIGIKLITVSVNTKYGVLFFNASTPNCDLQYIISSIKK